ncbi:MAG: dephospho-CoA kinase [Eubacteriales bacterium]|nr:dephospho-CoA kinase [Eubacteriales bacterium]
MKTIGITGGVGAGKSRILSYLEKNCNCRILLADEAAHRVREAGQPAYERLVGILGRDVLGEDGQIDRGRMAAKIFLDKKMLGQVNAVIHPAVREYILGEIGKERQSGKRDAFFLEAALLIEEGYGQLLDELWYIYADEKTRRSRLMQSRGYDDARISGIFASQLPEAEFRRHCKVVIDNSGSLGDTYKQIDEILREAGLKK